MAFQLERQMFVGGRGNFICGAANPFRIDLAGLQ